MKWVKGFHHGFPRILLLLFVPTPVSREWCADFRTFIISLDKTRCESMLHMRRYHDDWLIVRSRLVNVQTVTIGRYQLRIPPRNLEINGFTFSDLQANRYNLLISTQHVFHCLSSNWKSRCPNFDHRFSTTISMSHFRGLSFGTYGNLLYFLFFFWQEVWTRGWGYGSGTKSTKLLVETCDILCILKRNMGKGEKFWLHSLENLHFMWLGQHVLVAWESIQWNFIGELWN